MKCEECGVETSEGGLCTLAKDMGRNLCCKCFDKLYRTVKTIEETNSSLYKTAFEIIDYLLHDLDVMCTEETGDKVRELKTIIKKLEALSCIIGDNCLLCGRSLSYSSYLLGFHNFGVKDPLTEDHIRVNLHWVCYQLLKAVIEGGDE